MAVTGKNPTTPPVRLTARSGDIVAFARPLFRIHTTTGRHPIAWNGFRSHGPLTHMRWDHHPDPVGTHPGHEIAYTASDPTTAIAEVFQATRAIPLDASRTLSAWVPATPIVLLDLTGTWFVRNGASWSLSSVAKRTCRTWASAIHEQFSPDVEGLLVPSTMTGRSNVVLFERARHRLPSAPALSRPLSHPMLAPVMLDASRELGWPVR